MAARDQAIFMDMVVGIQRARKRKSYDSDSDSDINRSTNRGNKLKQRARFVRQGQLGAADGLAVFAEPIEYAGYRREIISHNPPLIDDEGYEIDSDVDDESAVQDAEAAAADLNPYAGIHLEQLLAPLTAVTDLPNHPMMSIPFTNKALTELAAQGCSWMHKENQALWKVKPLLIKLCGDHIWVDSGLLLTPNDADLFDDNFVAQLAAAQQQPAHGGRLLLDGPKKDKNDENDKNGNGNGTKQDADKDAEMTDAADETKGKAPTQPAQPVQTPPQTNGDHTSKPDGGKNGTKNGNVDDNDDSDALDSEDDGFIHPLYLPPRSSHPEPNLGLPEAEADDVRRLLQLWVQKQEEVSRGTKKLHEGLLRADRLRRTVMRWAKAEAHRDMSDGEDWFDKEEWGETEDLKKGHDEEEEDQQQTHKKTRNRK